MPWSRAWLFSSAYAALISKASWRKKVMTFCRFIRDFSGKTTADLSAALAGGTLCHPSWTGSEVVSSTVKSRTLYRFDRRAACSVHPRATHSSAFMVVDSSLPPKALEHISLSQGTREAPPQISTWSMEDIARPHEDFAASSTASTLCIMGLHISRKSARSTLLPKSWSSMRHSQERLASELADRIFFVFMTASSSLKRAFLLDSTSQPVFFWNCAAKLRMRHSSMSRPPTLSDLSHKTVSLPFTNCTTATENTVWPI
mmetsp:Transcript_76381/g.196710  ORF Transcript_76381/g.196710 Transcript_76381/m.196710 type:complete len:258 (+) Transcript_76381:990-1763(+)